MMDTQDAYEEIRAFFSKPNAEYGMDLESASCMYRTNDGARCAIGCLIPDNEYNPELEDESISQLVRVVPTLHGVDIHFLQDAQAQHDGCAIREEPMNSFIEALDVAAMKCGLTVVT